MNFKPLFSLSGGGTPSANPHQCKASETIAVGDLVHADADGLINKATAGDAKVVGVAASSVTSASASEQILVWDDPSLVYLATSDATLLQAMKYLKCDITSEQLVDVGVTGGSDAITVVDLYSNYDSSATDKQCLVTISTDKHALAAGGE